MMDSDLFVHQVATELMELAISPTEHAITTMGSYVDGEITYPQALERLGYCESEIILRWAMRAADH